MASRRKQHRPKGKAPTSPHQYAAFIGDVADGSIAAEALHEVELGNGRLRLDYDDPDGEEP